MTTVKAANLLARSQMRELDNQEGLFTIASASASMCSSPNLLIGPSFHASPQP